MNAKPLISVLIPVYNVELFVLEAVLSICNQSYRNLEIIVIDDCSTDNTFEILRKLSKTDNRIKLYRNLKNQKIAETLNFAFSKSKGEFIARMDGDDIASENKIELQYKYLHENPDVDLVGTNYILVNEYGFEIGRSKYIFDINNNIGIVKYESPVAHIWLARRALYINLGNYRLPGVEDYDFLLRALTSNYKLRNLNDYLYKVRVRSGNTVSSFGLSQRKAFTYAYDLYVYRMNVCNSDYFSQENFEKFISSTKFENFLYYYSCRFYERYMFNRKKNKILSLFMLCVSIFFYPNYQIKYLVNKLIINKIKNNANSSSSSFS